jgi:LysR family transcriptional regulator, regulator of abg operon
VKLSNLRALVAAIDKGSLRAAARQLGLSQPALTKALRDLEIELEAPLLVRSSVGVSPTAQGKVLHAHALTIMRELTAATDQVKQLSGMMCGQLAVGAVPLAVLLLMPETLRTFTAEFPNIELRLTEELYMAQLQRLRHGDVDIAVGGIPGSLPMGEFIVEELMITTMVPVVAKNSQRARARSLSELQTARWVYTGVTNAEGYAKALFEAHDLASPKVGAVVNSTLALLSLVINGDYVGLMPQQIASNALAADFLEVIPIRERGLDLKIGAMIRKDKAVAPAVRHFLAHLHRAANQH